MPDTGRETRTIPLHIYHVTPVVQEGVWSSVQRMSPISCLRSDVQSFSLLFLTSFSFLLQTALAVVEIYSCVWGISESVLANSEPRMVS